MHDDRLFIINGVKLFFFYPYTIQIWYFPWYVFTIVCLELYLMNYKIIYTRTYNCTLCLRNQKLYKKYNKVLSDNLYFNNRRIITKNTIKLRTMSSCTILLTGNTRSDFCRVRFVIIHVSYEPLKLSFGLFCPPPGNIDTIPCLLAIFHCYIDKNKQKCLFNHRIAAVKGWHNK